MDPKSSINSFIAQSKKNYLLKDLYTFSVEALGYSDLRPQPHLEMTQFLEEGAFEMHPGSGENIGLLLLTPRDTFKSTEGSIALPLYIWAKINPNARILLDSHKAGTARERADAVKWHIKSNPKFREPFGDWYTGTDKWNEDAFNINRKTSGSKEASLTVSGVDAAVTGGHYDVIIVDDAVSELNFQTELGREKVKKHIQMLEPLLEPGGLIVIIGTRYHHEDAYGWLIAQNEEHARLNNGKRDWKVLLRGAFDGPKGLYFPERLSNDFLAQKRRKMEAKLFACNYLNEPVEEGSQVFPPVKLRRFNGRFYFDGNCPSIMLNDGTSFPVRVTMALDPAFAGMQKNDANGITVVATDADDNWWVLHAEAYRGSINEVLKRLVDLIRRFRPEVFAWEVVSAQILYEPLLIRALEDARLPIPSLYRYKESQKKRKSIRIEALEPRYRAEQLFVKDDLTDLIEELRKYPELQHEDVLDSLAQHLEIAIPVDPDECYADTDEDDWDTEDEDDTDTRKRMTDGTWTGS